MWQPKVTLVADQTAQKNWDLIYMTGAKKCMRVYEGSNPEPPASEHWSLDTEPDGPGSIIASAKCSLSSAIDLKHFLKFQTYIF